MEKDNIHGGGQAEGTYQQKDAEKHAGAAPHPASYSTLENPVWQKSDRFHRTARMTLEAPAATIFPLLCPVLEYRWLPGWACTMCYSDSGVVENNAIFHTREKHGRTIVWTTIAYRPHSFIEFLVVDATDTVNRFSISLEEKGNTTELTWRMLFTATSAEGSRALRHGFTEEKFKKMIDDRKTELAYYLKTGRMLPKSK
jgi:hypothetical protein